MDHIMFGIAERLEGMGIGIPMMVDAAMILYVSHGISPEEARGIIAAKLAARFFSRRRAA